MAKGTALCSERPTQPFEGVMRTSVHAVRVAGVQCPVSRSRRPAVAILGLSLQRQQQGAVTHFSLLVCADQKKELMY